MTRISYSKSHLDENIEFSNLMMNKDGDVLFIEINFNENKVKLKNLEDGKELKNESFLSEEEAKKRARSFALESGVFINEEIRKKEKE